MIEIGARTAVMMHVEIAPIAPAMPWQRYARLDRGSYEHTEADVPAQLIALACEVTGRALAVAEARLLRFVPGDYLLAHADRVHEDLPIELIADVSPTCVVGGTVHYRRRGRVFFGVPAMPGSVSIVERGPTVTCNHGYVSKLSPPGSEVVRLVVLLR